MDGQRENSIPSHKTLFVGGGGGGGGGIINAIRHAYEVILRTSMLNIEHKIHASWSKFTMFPLGRLYPLESYCNFWPRSLKSTFVQRVFMLINLSLVVRKPAFCICENKDADQLRSNYCAADQRRWFRYTDSTIPLLPIYEIFKLLAIFCGCTAWFVLDLSEIPKTGFLTTRLIS